MTSSTKGDLNHWEVPCGKAVPFTTATNTYLNCDQQGHSETPLTLTTKSPSLGFHRTRTGSPQSPVPIRAAMDGPALVRITSDQGLAQRAGHRWAGRCSVQSGSAILKLDHHLSLLSTGSEQLWCMQKKLLDKVRPDILLQMHATRAPAPSRGHRGLRHQAGDIEIWSNKEDTTLQTIPKKALNHWELLQHPEVLLTLWKETNSTCPFMFADNQQSSNGCDSFVLPHLPIYWFKSSLFCTCLYLLLPLPTLLLNCFFCIYLLVFHRFPRTVFCNTGIPFSIPENPRRCAA